MKKNRRKKKNVINPVECAERAASVVNGAEDLDGKLDYSPASLELLDRVLFLSNDLNPVIQLMFVTDIGFYYGEVLVRNLSGEWKQVSGREAKYTDFQWYVRLDCGGGDGAMMFPFNTVWSRLREPNTKSSLAAQYKIAATSVETMKSKPDDLAEALRSQPMPDGSKLNVWNGEPEPVGGAA